jgi:spore coat polysaccharide biosynthesis protein SpsF (cytidylyltransferase family)/aryl-alcohol dehydrogenase-like predicted oxidoreductase
VSPQTRIIVQARTDSSRLPGKALLPVAGIPSAVLAVLRAGNTGRDIRLATSDRSIDDRLTQVAQASGIAVHRGSAHDVRARFLSACADLADDAVVVRLTADNLLPDAHLIDETIEAFFRRQGEYFNLDMHWQNVPYGLSVEVFRLAALRECAASIDSSVEREHVTPCLRKRHESFAEPIQIFNPNESAIRCTMDTFDDFLRMDRCFDGVDEPINVPWKELLQRMVDADDAPVAMSPGPGLVVGTVQLAAPYGSAVTVQPPEPDEAIVMVRKAISNGISGIDTARAYAGSERLIGQALKQGYAGRCQVITKLSPLEGLADTSSPRAAADAAEISVARSLRALGGDIQPLLLLHRADHLERWGGAVWNRLRELHEEGQVASLGVSVQSPSEAILALDQSDVTLIQLPCNLLDWRWKQSGVIERIEKAEHVSVHVRSVFLQGTLLRPASDWPRIADLDPESLIGFLENAVAQYGRRSITDLCVAWARAQPWINGLVIGMENEKQLEDNLELFTHPPMTKEEAEQLSQEAPVVPEQLLNPAQWNK